MAYRKHKRFRKFGKKKRRAGSVAGKVARKAYRGAMRMPKRKLAKVYATKCGQTAFRTVKKKRRFHRRRY